MAIRATAPGRAQDFMVTIRQTLLRAGEERAQADGGWMLTFQVKERARNRSGGKKDRSLMKILITSKNPFK